MEISEGDYAFLSLLGMDSPSPPPPPPKKVGTKRQREEDADALDLAFLDIVYGTSTAAEDVAVPEPPIAPRTKRRRVSFAAPPPVQDAYQRVVKRKKQKKASRITAITNGGGVGLAESVPPPISDSELRAMHDHSHSIEATKLIKKVSPHDQRKKPPRRCDRMSVTETVEATLGPEDTANLQCMPTVTLSEDDFRRKGGPTEVPTETIQGTTDPRKSFLENDLIFNEDVIGAITDATGEDAELIDAVSDVVPRADALVPVAERATVQRAFCKDLIVRSLGERDQRIAATKEWIMRNSSDPRYYKQLLRKAVLTHSLSDGIRMHRVRFEEGCGFVGEEIRHMPFHSSSFLTNNKTLVQRIALPRKYEEEVLLHAPITELRERACSNGPSCKGQTMFTDAHFELRELVFPDEYHKFLSTGTWPHIETTKPRLCLLCTRAIISAGYSSSIGSGEYTNSHSFVLGNIYNYTDRVGEYCLSDCLSYGNANVGLVGSIARHTISKYSTKVKRTTLPTGEKVDVQFVIQHGFSPVVDGSTKLHFNPGPP